jgi:Domain of unknown function (DUF4160)
MAKIECFAVAGIETWFFSNGHLPPHFHAKRKGQWEIRVHFLESSASEMFHVVWRKGEEIPRIDTKLLEEKVAAHRAEILEEWERKVQPQ